MTAVEIFTTDTPCMSCRYVKHYLTKHGVSFVEQPTTDEIRDEFFQRGFREFPIVVYNGRAFSGMREADLQRLVRDYRYFEG